MFPQVPFIVPHFGAGMLREAFMAADTCGNVHFDTSSSNNWVRYTPGLTLEAVFRDALQVAGPSRLLFGTDSSFFPRGWQRAIYDAQQRIVEKLGIGAADRDKIFGLNFERLFPGTSA
jgi:predicted TIM-barrel fold metal-dependent hydrolase